MDVPSRSAAEYAPRMVNYVLTVIGDDRAGLVEELSRVINDQGGSWEESHLSELAGKFVPVTEATEQDHCGACKACINVCPTDAIVGPKQLDARRCISYLTIESRNPNPVHLRRHMGNRIFGCDDCQLYCPWNRDAPGTTERDFQPRHHLDDRALVSLFEWSEEEFLKRTEGSAIRRINYEQWQRNLAVALGNGPASETAVAALQRRRPTASPMVAEHIDWALGELQGATTLAE